MSKFDKPNGLIQEIGAIAGLYKTVFWMMGQRARRGAHWEEELTADALRPLTLEEQREAQLSGSPRHN